jgi:hypothetical protein
MDMKDRYLSNPHITLDEKRKKKLGINTQDVKPNTVAIELENDIPSTKKQVIVKKVSHDSEEANPDRS